MEYDKTEQNRIDRLNIFEDSGLFVCWLLNVQSRTGYSISGTDLLRQFYVLPH